MVFTDEEIQQVWEKGTIVDSYDSTKCRKDKCTAWMTRSSYGNRNSIYGWEIHHIDNNTENNKLENLMPLQWENNCVTSDNKKLSCPIISNGNSNVRQ
jgi:hypothetical protein